MCSQDCGGGEGADGIPNEGVGGRSFPQDVYLFGLPADGAFVPVGVWDGGCGADGPDGGHAWAGTDRDGSRIGSESSVTEFETGLPFPP